MKCQDATGGDQPETKVRSDGNGHPAIIGQRGDPVGNASFYDLLCQLDRNVNGPERERCEPKGRMRHGKGDVHIPHSLWCEMQNHATRQLLESPAHRHRATLQAGVAGAASELVSTDLLASEFVRPLREDTNMPGGIRTLGGLVGDIAIARQSGTSTVMWFNTETEQVTMGAPSTELLSMTPHENGAMVPFSRQLEKQSTPAIQSLIIEDLQAVMERNILRSILIGPGTGGKPKGIAAYDERTSSTAGLSMKRASANGTAVDFALLQELRWSPRHLNAAGTVNFCLPSKLAERLSQTKYDASFTVPNYLMGEDSMVIGQPTNVTNLLPQNMTKGSSTRGTCEFIVGDFSEVIVGRWGGVDLLVDRYTKAEERTTRVFAYSDMDVLIRHPEAFALVTDALQTA